MLAPIAVRPTVAAPTPATVAAAPRFRFAIGTHGGYGRYGASEGAGFLAAMHLSMGVQLSDLIAIEAQGSGAYLALLAYGRANLYVDFTPVAWASVALGPVYSAGVLSETSGTLAGASLRAAVHPWSYRHGNGVRSALNLAIEADLGATLSESCGECAPPAGTRTAGNVGWGLYASLGYLRY